MAKVLFHLVDGPNGEELTVTIGSMRKVVREDNALFEDILKACDDNDEIKARELIDKAFRVEKTSGGRFQVIDSVVHIDGKVADSGLSNKIIKFMERGLSYDSLVAFWRRLQNNPSYRSRQQLFRYLDSNAVPIVSDEIDGVDYTGCFVAWKAVREDFTDHHSGTFDNSPGRTIEMDRGEVDDNPNNTCSQGLHVADLDYAWGFYNGRRVKVYIDPADVVSIPIDYNNQKMRVCKYYVVEEVETLEEAEKQREDLVHAPVREDAEVSDEEKPLWDDACSICGSEYCEGYCDDDDEDDEDDDDDDM